jgi:DNA-binding NtrC family response regulator
VLRGGCPGFNFLLYDGVRHVMTDPLTEILLGDGVELTLHVVKAVHRVSAVHAACDSARCEQSRSPVSAHVAFAADTVTRVLIGRTVAAVERDLIMATLKHCFGNRTHAANILGISIRTLRNRINEYAADGVPIPPPGGGDMRMAG